MHDVIIAGAGPVGLFLACELGFNGCSVLVLERESGTSPWRAAPAGNRGLHAAAIATLDRRGLLEPLLARLGPQPPRQAGHFAGLALDPDAVDADALPYRVPGSLPGFLLADLASIEAVLTERALGLGVEIRRGAEVTAVAQDADRVLATAGGHAYAAHWLAGCDGGRSAVRRLAGFEFTGTPAEATGYTLVADLDDPGKLRPGHNLTPNGMYITMPAPGHLALMDFDGGAYERTRPPDRAQLQAVLRRVTGTDVAVGKVHFASAFSDAALQATEYRRRRVLLAGDAAHIHPPFGGQGLNTGIGDAVNLGWKLAATVRDRAPHGLLDTYAAERRPVGAAVLDWTRAQAAAMRPDPHSRALREVLAEVLATREGATRVFARIAGLATRYDVGDGNPLVGRVVPELRLADGRRLAELMRDGRGVLLDLTEGEALRGVDGGGTEGLRYAAGSAEADLGVEALLVRPDGVVAWAAERGMGAGLEAVAVARACGRWFGAGSSGAGG